MYNSLFIENGDELYTIGFFSYDIFPTVPLGSSFNNPTKSIAPTFMYTLVLAGNSCSDSHPTALTPNSEIISNI